MSWLLDFFQRPLASPDMLTVVTMFFGHRVYNWIGIPPICSLVMRSGKIRTLKPTLLLYFLPLLSSYIPIEREEEWDQFSIFSPLQTQLPICHICYFLPWIRGRRGIITEI